MRERRCSNAKFSLKQQGHENISWSPPNADPVRRRDLDCSITMLNSTEIDEIASEKHSWWYSTSLCAERMREPKSSDSCTIRRSGWHSVSLSSFRNWSETFSARKSAPKNLFGHPKVDEVLQHQVPTNNLSSNRLSRGTAGIVVRCQTISVISYFKALTTLCWSLLELSCTPLRAHGTRPIKKKKKNTKFSSMMQLRALEHQRTHRVVLFVTLSKLRF